MYKWIERVNIRQPDKLTIDEFKNTKKNLWFVKLLLKYFMSSI